MDVRTDVICGPPRIAVGAEIRLRGQRMPFVLCGQPAEVQHVALQVAELEVGGLQPVYRRSNQVSQSSSFEMTGASRESMEGLPAWYVSIGPWKWL